MRPLNICHFQQTVKKVNNLDILSHFVQKKGEGGYGIFFLSCQNLQFLRFFLKSIKNDFWPEKGRISFILFYNRLGNTCGLNPSEKDREKHCFLILSLLSHNLNGKLLFSQKRVSKASNLIACCFWCFQILIFMLSNYTFDALLQGQSIQSVEIERPFMYFHQQWTCGFCPFF